MIVGRLPPGRIVGICCSKIHRATVTETCLGHESSLRVDEELLEAAGIMPYQAVVCSNVGPISPPAVV